MNLLLPHLPPAITWLSPAPHNKLPRKKAMNTLLPQLPVLCTASYNLASSLTIPLNLLIPHFQVT